MKLNRFFLLIGLCLFTSFVLKAQKTYDLGLYGGGVNYFGEIGKKAFISPNRPFFGVLGKINFNERISARASVIYLSLVDNDRNAKDNYRGNGRGKDLYYSFNNKFVEAALALEYVPFSFFKQTNPIDFYVFGGLGVYYGNKTYYPLSEGFEDIQAQAYGKGFGMSLPLGAGFKTFVGQHFILGIELAPRYSLFSDNLDGSHPDAADFEPNRLDNVDGSNDWYTFIGISLTYRLGKGNAAFCDCY